MSKSDSAHTNSLPFEQPSSEPARSAEQDQYYEHVRQRLLANPTDVEAWLLMSRLVNTVEQQQACLSTATSLMQGVQNMTFPAIVPLDGMQQKPAAAAPEVAPSPVPAGPTPRRIGEYLIARGALTFEQLQDALHEQRHRRRYGELVPIGDILVARRLVTARVLAEALVEMHQERMHATDAPPFLLGEYLLAAGMITPEQLADVLEEQIIASQAGRYALFGAILIRRGMITQDQLDAFLEHQRNQRTDQGRAT
jgi:hypothetical protein